MEFYQKEVAGIFRQVDGSRQGLSSAEASARLARVGPNEVKRVVNVSVIQIVLRQLKSFINYVMFFAVVLSFFLGSRVDAVVILAILVVNILLGFFQEFKAERAMQALLKLAAPKALVVRDGRKVVIPAREVVPGDILVIEEGAVIPADARVFEVAELKVDESILTGESVPVRKMTGVMKRDVPVADRKNCVNAATTVVSGRGRAVVVATGMQTEVGKIAREVQMVEREETPLQVQLKRLGFFITVVVVGLAVIIFGLDFFRTGEVVGAILVAVALAVAAIPEGLPAVITITLALGTQRMLRKNVLMRKLNAVETLGSTSVICADKTGTMTKNKMEVVEVWAQGRSVRVEKDKLVYHDHAFSDPRVLGQLWEVCVSCNNASLEGVSDPTEQALLVVAKKAGYGRVWARLREVPFTSERKFMVTVDRGQGRVVGHMKGAPEVVVGKCTHRVVKGRVVRLGRREREEILAANMEMAGRALRVLGCAMFDAKRPERVVFVGLVGMIDPPREGVREAVTSCQAAGIRVVMVTGDHAVTAKAIGAQIGVVGRVVTGEELERMDDGELAAQAGKIAMYARVSPHQKVKILRALQSGGAVVAMTGDGVNDALALKRADIGIAPGSGSDVAKGASDMVLLDDHFVSIVEAVREGRGIYENLKKFVSFLFSSNFAEVLIILLALVIGLPLPLVAVQILWVNLLTDGFPALALGVDPVARGIMGRKPRRKAESFFSWRELFFIVLQAVVITSGVLGVFWWYMGRESLVYAQTVAFSTLVVFELLNAVNYHMRDRRLLSRELFSNGWLFVAMGASLLAQLVIVYFFNGLFNTVGLVLVDWVMIALVACSIVVVQEVAKQFISSV